MLAGLWQSFPKPKGTVEVIFFELLPPDRSKEKQMNPKDLENGYGCRKMDPCMNSVVKKGVELDPI